MSFAAIREASFAPVPGVAAPAAVRSAAPARRLRDALEPLAMHAVWSPTVHDALEPRGLGFLDAYVWGRATALGEPDGSIVAATFGAFEPGRISAAYEQGRSQIGRAELLAVLDDAVAASLRQRLGTESTGAGAGGTESTGAAPEADGTNTDATGATGADLARAVAILRRAVEGAEGAGRPLFSGVRALGWPDDVFAQLWRGCHALREHRGDGHIAADLGAGFDPVEMNILTELWHGYPLGAYSGTRAWPAARTEAALTSLRARGLLDGEQLTPAGVAAREDVEARTDAMDARVVDAIGDDLDWLVAALDRWSAACIANGAFPQDPRKRAAG
jgi:hypothetical protein